METNAIATLLDEAAKQPAAEPAVQAQPSVQAQPAQQPQTDDMQLKLRAQELIAQAMTIRAVVNVDVLAVYNTDAEARARILSGEWDFIDLYKAMKPAPTPPAPVRSANGGAGALNVNGMNDQQFQKLNEMLSRGAKVDMRY